MIVKTNKLWLKKFKVLFEPHRKFNFNRKEYLKKEKEEMERLPQKLTRPFHPSPNFVTIGDFPSSHFFYVLSETSEASQLK